MKNLPINSIQKILSNSKKLKILLVASEAAPFAKAGGLGDVIGSLSWALRDLGQDARIMIPYYGSIDREKYKTTEEIKKLKVPTEQLGDYPFLVCNVKKYCGKKSVPTYFLENEEYYEKRANVYGYADDHIRWALFCRGIIEFIRKSLWKPDIILASDWQTGLLPNFIKLRYQNDPVISKIPIVFAIHNLQYQGMCEFKFLSPDEKKDNGTNNIPDFFNPQLAKLNWLLRGIQNSEIITTVSPDYAKEIMTAEFGEGINEDLKKRERDVFGILNGISNEHNNPSESPHVPFHYNSEKLFIRKNNKEYIQEKFGLPKKSDIFLATMVTRLTEQKGLDLIDKIGESLFENLSLQMIFIGDGEPRYKEIIHKLAQKFPDKIKYHFEFDVNLPKLIFSGADALIMPSKFEPCGITQMEAMRYGCIPIVRQTGGLISTVDDFDAQKEKGTGFVFEKYDSMALYNAIVKASTVFEFKDSWNKMIKRAMKKDFSWKNSAKKYLFLFHKIIKK